MGNFKSFIEAFANSRHSYIFRNSSSFEWATTRAYGVSLTTLLLALMQLLNWYLMVY